MGKGEFFSLASAIVWAFSVILFKRSGATMPPFALNLFKNAFAVLLMAPTIMMLGGPMPDIGLQDLAILTGSGFIGIALADTLYFKALNKIGASRTGIVSSIYSPSIIVLSYFVLGERLGALQWLGFTLVLAGVLLVSYRAAARDVHSDDLRRGVALAAMAVLLMAIGIVMVKHILEQQPFLWTVEIRLLGGTIGMLMVMLIRGRTQVTIDQFRAPHNWSQICVGSFLGAYVAIMFWMAGYKYTLASIASVLNETASIFIMLLAWLMLREPLTRRKLLGLTCSFGGVVLMLS
jgi:drug/metabolite transporter (DMT)-like permease